VDFWRIAPLATLKRQSFGLQQSQKFGVAFSHKAKIARNRFGCSPLPDKRRDSGRLLLALGRARSFRLGHQRRRVFDQLGVEARPVEVGKQRR
jgi:hypothetical protein